MAATIRFGPFEVDAAAMEVRKNGTRLRLQEQPFRMLMALIAKPGQVVTREELKRLLWSDGTYVDFDQSLNKAANRLREVLNDNAAEPRYIETIPRRGYRFLAHVENSESNAETSAPADMAVKQAGNRTLLIASTACVGVLGLVALILILARPRTQTEPSRLEVLIHDASSPSLSHDGKLLAYVSVV